MLFYILLTTAVTAIPKKSLVSIPNDEIIFFFLCFTSLAVKQQVVLTDYCSPREIFTAEVILLMPVEQGYFTLATDPSH